MFHCLASSGTTLWDDFQLANQYVISASVLIGNTK